MSAITIGAKTVFTLMENSTLSPGNYVFRLWIPLGPYPPICSADSLRVIISDAMGCTRRVQKKHSHKPPDPSRHFRSMGLEFLSATRAGVASSYWNESMTLDILGIHHVTAITGKPQANLDFYTRTLGLKLVKQTVNFDDPSSYHLYYGDGLGRPGTLLTFFLWPDVSPATVGPGQTCSITLAAPLAALSFWQQRLASHGVAVQRLPTSDGLDRLTFRDPDGISLEILADTADQTDLAPTNALIAPQFALRGIHAVTLLEPALVPTRDFLQATFRFTSRGGSTCELHSQTHDQQVTARIHLLEQRNQPRGRIGAGYIHHLAFRVADQPSQQQWFQHLIAMKYNVSPIMDRVYFRSIYFREPGGVLLELATDGPGFTVDEPVEVLGKRLQLPAWLEAQRGSIMQTLPPIHFD